MGANRAPRKGQQRRHKKGAELEYATLGRLSGQLFGPRMAALRDDSLLVAPWIFGGHLPAIWPQKS